MLHNIAELLEPNKFALICGVPRKAGRMLPSVKIKYTRSPKCFGITASKWC